MAQSSNLLRKTDFQHDAGLASKNMAITSNLYFSIEGVPILMNALNMTYEHPGVVSVLTKIG